MSDTIMPIPFKKLHPDIKERLETFEISTPTPFQKKSIPIIKSGTNFFGIAPEGSGKTTTMILTTMQKLKCEAVGNAPRAVVLVENKEIALEMYDAFIKYTKYTPLRVYVGYEQLHIDVQKSEIFMGVDILISTPGTMNKLFLTNGVSMADLKIFSVDDTLILNQSSNYNAMMSITQSIQKCQYVLYSETNHPVLERFIPHFMEYAKTVSL
ncbi:DEAD/DEAH box helicase [Flavobacteriaceae bacterium MAR_2010_188]|nr:DEAD/DEAH box helicase [Flavobacteriaceae bacterium MAR_2010_188]